MAALEEGDWGFLKDFLQRGRFDDAGVAELLARWPLARLFDELSGMISDTPRTRLILDVLSRILTPPGGGALALQHETLPFLVGGE